MPKNVDVVYYDENGCPTSIKTYHFEDEQDRQGWYYFNGEPYLTKTALKKDFGLNDVKLKEIIENKDIDTETVSNEYRTFTVYNLSDVQRVKSEIDKI